MKYYVDDEGIRVELYDDEFEVHSVLTSETVWIYRNGQFVHDCEGNQNAYDWIEELLDDEGVEQ